MITVGSQSCHGQVGSRLARSMITVGSQLGHVPLTLHSSHAHSSHAQLTLSSPSGHGLGLDRNVLTTFYSNLFHVHHVRKLNQKRHPLLVRIFSRRVAAPTFAPDDVSAIVGMNGRVCDVRGGGPRLHIVRMRKRQFWYLQLGERYLKK
jgi:hypothetical protein